MKKKIKKHGEIFKNIGENIPGGNFLGVIIRLGVFLIPNK